MCRIAMLLDNPFRPDPRVVREAQTLSASGHQVTIYAWDRDPETKRPLREKVGEINIIRIPVKTRQQLGIRQFCRFFLFAWHAFWIILREEYDVVHCHDFLNLPVGVLIKIVKGIPLVYDAHEIYWIMESRKYPSFLLAFLKYSEISLLSWVDFFITVGRTRVEYYQRYYHKPIYIIGNWYDRRELDRESGEEIRSQLGIPKDAFLIAYTGTLAPSRASNVLLNVVEQLEDDPRIHWVICGNGINRLDFEQAASQNPHLHFLGWIEDVTPVLSTSNALIYLLDMSHPYAKYSSPNNLYLSIAWVLPLIGVAIGEIGEILIDEETGILINTMDEDTVCSAIRKLFIRDDLYEQIVIKLKELQNIYSWHTASQRLLNVYELIDKKNN